MTIDNRHEVPAFATLVEYDPPKRLAYTSPDGGGMVVSVDFDAVGSGTRVRLVHSGIPNMRVDGDIELREIIRGGWTAAFGKLVVVLALMERRTGRGCRRRLTPRVSEPVGSELESVEGWSFLCCACCVIRSKHSGKQRICLPNQRVGL